MSALDLDQLERVAMDELGARRHGFYQEIITPEQALQLVRRVRAAEKPAQLTKEQRLDIIKRHLKPGVCITHTRCMGIIEEHLFTGWDGIAICGKPTVDTKRNGGPRYDADDIHPNNVTHIGRVPVEALDFLAERGGA